MERSMRRTTRGTLLTAILVSLPFLAFAQPKLYHSPGSTGSDPGQPPPLDPATETVYLFFDPGSTTTSNGEEVCDSSPGGDGDESCGVHFELRVTGDLSIQDFTPEVGVAEVNLSGGNKQLSVALLTTGSPLSTGPTRVGTMIVDSSGTSGGVGEVTKLDSVDASLDLQSGVPRQLFQVPEPGGLPMLACGGGLLAWLARRRARRAAR